MIRIGKAADFVPGRIRTFRLLGRPVGVICEVEGTWRAMEMGCKHQGADLSEGRRQGDEITCPWHGWRYNLKTGACVWGGITPLRQHACELRGEDVFVSLRPRPEGAQCYNEDSPER